MRVHRNINCTFMRCKHEKYFDGQAISAASNAAAYASKLNFITLCNNIKFLFIVLFSFSPLKISWMKRLKNNFHGAPTLLAVERK